MDPARPVSSPGVSAQGSLPVVAAIVTHRRPEELARLLADLGASMVPLAGCVLADHAPDGSVTALAQTTPFETIVIEDATNPGPGAGWAHAARRGLEHFPHAQAVLFLDDDVRLVPEAVSGLWEEMQAAHAESIAPLLEDAAGKLWAFPEPESPELRGTIRAANTPAEARARLGDAALPFCWCTGACYLVSRSAIARCGLHRTDFWLLGEDLEYSMRIAGATRAVFTCKITVPHLPPPPASPEAARRSDYGKFCSLLQNLAYLGFHAPHSRHMKRYLPGNFRRFLRTHSAAPRTLRDAAACFWNGAVLGQPAGTASGARLRSRIASYVF